jgi:hypothetical protein
MIITDIILISIVIVLIADITYLTVFFYNDFEEESKTYPDCAKWWNSMSKLHKLFICIMMPWSVIQWMWMP